MATVRAQLGNDAVSSSVDCQREIAASALIIADGSRSSGAGMIMRVALLAAGSAINRHLLDRSTSCAAAAI